MITIDKSTLSSRATPESCTFSVKDFITLLDRFNELAAEHEQLLIKVNKLFP